MNIFQTATNKAIIPKVLNNQSGNPLLKPKLIAGVIKIDTTTEKMTKNFEV
ncbi:hypothetical protein LLT5_13560 [Lactococcus cremoris subsp. cremoris TIFN5]|nr:hypothetical protein LLT5_13560 [Lactococcus cremoris subsp. cremoris TIFN5]KZK41228.1 hypothetical protein B40_2074 [Lactococcus cremoris]